MRPLQIREISGCENDKASFEWLMDRYHYLGYRSSVDMKVKYLVRDREERHLAWLFFRTAAWKCARDDEFYG